MPILLLFSVVFKIWMLVDAFQRKGERYWYIVICIPFGEFVYFFLVKFPEIDHFKDLFSSKPKIPCRNCMYCGVIYEEGVRCEAGVKPLFKTLTHIKYCRDFEEKLD